jgi:hypothetical protein
MNQGNGALRKPELVGWLRPVFSVAIPLYVFLNFSRFYYENIYLTQALTLLLVAAGLALFFIILLKYYSNTLYSFASFFLMLSVIGVSLVGQNDTSKALLLFFANLGFASVLVKYPISPKISRNIFIGFSLVFLALILSGKKAEDIFLVSRNYVSIFFLLLVSIHYFACWRYDTKPSLLYSIVGLLFSVLSIGRAGIVVFAVLFFLTFIFVEEKKAKIILIVTISVSAIFLFLKDHEVELFGSFELIYTGFERFERLGTESARHSINASYLTSAFKNVENFIFGVPLSSLDSVQAVGGNPHNSFINLHVNFGIFGLMVLLISIIIAAGKLFISKSWLVLIVFSACLVRAFFDVAAFYGPLDIIVMMPLVYFLSNVRFLTDFQMSSTQKIT